MNRKIKFGVFADLHIDIMPDPLERLEVFLQAAKRENVDFIIELGDFCYPDKNRKCVCPVEKLPANVKNALMVKTYADTEKIRDLFNNFEKPSYHVLGNHECDMCSKKETTEFIGFNGATFYSFDMGGFHFIVLDASYYKKNGTYHTFENGNYFAEGFDFKIEENGGERLLPYIPPEQLNWLKEDLAKTKLPSVVFSHQCLMENNDFSVANASVVKQILKNAPNGVVACFNGHEHVDYEAFQDGIWFVNINSISNTWIGEEFEYKGLYGEETDEKYPNVRYTVPFRDAVYAIIEIDEDGINICGTQSEYVGPTPKERGVYNPDSWWMKSDKRDLMLTASIKSRYLCFKK